MDIVLTLSVFAFEERCWWKPSSARQVRNIDGEAIPSKCDEIAVYFINHRALNCAVFNATS